MAKSEQEKWLVRREEMINLEVEKFVAKRNFEIQGLIRKMTQSKTEFDTTRANNCEKIQTKGKNKMKEMLNIHKLQIAEFHNPRKGGIDKIRPNATLRTTGGFGQKTN